MADADSSGLVAGPSLDNLTITNTTSVTPFSQLKDVDFLLLEAQLIFSAIGIIYVGAHASLRRPPSAAARTRKPGKKPSRNHDDEQRFSQGLEWSDAILFPLLAGCILVGLYYLIQWLQDPAILNKILQWYMSTMSIASLMTLYSHGYELATSLAFPEWWRARDGRVRKACQKARMVKICDDAGNAVEDQGAESGTPSPLPGILGILTPTQKLTNAAWGLRAIHTKEWTFTIAGHGIGREKMNFKYAHVQALVLALVSAGVYFTTTSPFLSNLLGYGMCYGSMLLLSPTDFMTGALVLAGLFLYDIVMVFYTPYMVTVATTLDVPIKLSFKVAAHKSILGLGDIVLPGMLMGWTLRFDLWRHYLHKTKYETTDLRVLSKDETTGAVTTSVETKHVQIKAPYVDVTGRWGDWFWLQSLLPVRGRGLPAEVASSQFAKTYFHASVVGYFLGMVFTLAMLLIFKRGQPALLYLVPGVLGSICVTALVRGELKELWTYTEDGSLDVKDVVVDLDSEGKAVRTVGRLKNGVVDTTKGEEGKEDEEQINKLEEYAAGRKKTKKSHEIFLLSVIATSDDEELDEQVM